MPTAPADDAGAASGLVNTFHQVGTCLGLGIAVAAAATIPKSGTATLDMASQVSAALTTASVLLLLTPPPPAASWNILPCFKTAKTPQNHPLGRAHH
ncbi:hypothetical protein [Paenarthrobacter sp. TA1.8]|uniref:hypothetical protein n=1 Tax=Paenarthrobacter sp. TA1.8 TaxID=3400219 RepID=UPI003B42CD5A